MKKMMGFGAVLLIIGLILFAMSAPDGYDLLFNKVKIEDKTFSEYEENDVAYGEIKYVVSKIGTLEERSKLFGIPVFSVTGSLYLIADNGGYVLIDVRDGADKFDEITEQTAARLADSTKDTTSSADFVGRAVEVTDEQYDLVKSYFDGQNVDESQWGLAISLYVLVQFDTGLIVMQLCISLGLVVIGIILLVISRRYRFGKEVFVGEKLPGEETGREPAGPKSDEKEESTEDAE